MAGTVPGARGIKSNYTDSIFKRCTSREEDMHMGRQLPNSEVNRMMTITLMTTITYWCLLCAWNGAKCLSCSTTFTLPNDSMSEVFLIACFADEET